MYIFLLAHNNWSSNSSAFKFDKGTETEYWLKGTARALFMIMKLQIMWFYLRAILIVIIHLIFM